MELPDLLQRQGTTIKLYEEIVPKQEDIVELHDKIYKATENELKMLMGMIFILKYQKKKMIEIMKYLFIQMILKKIFLFVKRTVTRLDSIGVFFYIFCICFFIFHGVSYYKAANLSTAT